MNFNDLENDIKYSIFNKIDVSKHIEMLIDDIRNPIILDSIKTAVIKRQKALARNVIANINIGETVKLIFNSGYKSVVTVLQIADDVFQIETESTMVLWYPYTSIYSIVKLG